MYDKNSIKLGNEYGLITQITTDSIRTKVEWQLVPGSYEYVGKITLPQNGTEGVM